MKSEEITLKNTKAEILDALNEALEREQKLNKIKSDPVKEEKQKATEKVVKSSIENVSNNIFSEELNKKFKDLEIAIEAEETKLKELYGVSKELNNLTLVVNASKDYLNDLESKKKEKTDEINKEIKELEESYTLKSQELQKEYDLSSKNLKTIRDRETEEYNYKVKREREIENNKWEDEKKQRTAKLKEQEEETKRLLDSAKSNEEEFNSMKTKISEFPSLLENEYNRGKNDKALELEKDFKYETELLKKDYQNTIDRQQDKIESLKEEITKLTASNNTLQTNIDKAYEEIKSLATKTVETTGSVKIIGNNSNSNENK